MPLTTRARVKLELRIPTGVTQFDALIDAIVDEVDDAVLSAIGMPAGITTATYNEVYDVESWPQDMLRLRRFPIVSVAALTVNRSAWDVAGDDAHAYVYNAEAGWLRTTDSVYSFPCGRQIVRICYRAGYDAVPDRLARAATLIAVKAYNAGGNAGLQSENIGSYSYTLASETVNNHSAWPSEAWLALAEFRRVIPYSGGVRSA